MSPSVRPPLALSVILVAACHGAVLSPAAAQEKAGRPAVPSQQEQSLAEKLLRDKHKEAYAKAKDDPSATVALAVKILDQVRATKGDPAGLFVGLVQARDLAAGVGDLIVAGQAAEELAAAFAVDLWAMKGEALATAVAAIKTPEGARSLVEAGLLLADEAVAADHFEPAARLARLTEQASRRTRDLPLVLSVQKLERGIQAAAKQYVRLKDFVDKLQKDPDDPEANLEVGRYLGLLKGNWERSLFLLAQGNDPALRLLAQRDLTRPETTKAQLAMGDAWWQQGEKEKDQAQVHLRQRAVFWYEQALAGADELTRPRLEERMASVPRPRPRPPSWDYVGPPRELVTLRGNNNAVFGVAFSPDGKKVLSGSVSTQAILWDAASGKQLHLLNGHGGMIWNVAFEPRGRHLFTSSWDGTVKMWEVRTGREIRHFPAQNRINNINGLAVSPDGRRLLTGSDEGAVRVWDIETGRELRQLRGHNGFVYGVAFSPDGRQALSGGSNDGLMIHWDVNTGRELRRFQGLRGNIRSLAFSPDGRKALSTGDNDVILWDLTSGQEVRRYRGHPSPVCAVAFSPDGRRILSGGTDGTVRLWDTASGRELHRFTSHTSAVFGVAFSPGGGRAVSGSQDTTVRVWGLPR
jgi:hypothetical protein